MITSYLMLIDVVFIALASWRLSYMLVSEDGNMSLAYAVRLLGVKPIAKEVSRYDAWKLSLKSTSRKTPVVVTNNFGKMLQCIWCTSVVVSLIYYTLYFFFATNVFFSLFTLGLVVSTLVLVVENKFMS